VSTNKYLGALLLIKTDVADTADMLGEGDRANSKFHNEMELAMIESK
jgi:hypothetical protein